MFAQKNAQLLSPRAKYEQQYKAGRTAMLSVALLTVISLIYLYFSGRYFLFSAYLPISLFSEALAAGEIANGTYEYMSQLTAEDISFYSEMADLLMIMSIAVAVVAVVGYLICWALSKKHPAAVIVATVFFAVDSAIVLLDFVSYLDYTMLLDIVFHALVIYYLIAAIVANGKLKKLPPEEEAPVEGEFSVVNGEKVPSASATPSEEVVNVETESNDSNTPAE